MVNPTTGAITIWSTHTNGAPFDSSWASDSAVVFEWQPGVRGPAARYRVLQPSGRPPIC